ncbi:MAG TPA: sigma-70 family RNA polymerase sigma factor [Gemmataceae bacterium]|nr:sigma-70 family RNA polymerase sigma factor [Gemmataceae bacterium]
MATGQLDGVIRHLRRMARARDLGHMTDGQLLECFVARREEAAFEALVRRFGPMVLGVCQRVLRDRHDAEDAFQATFLVLLRKAGSITRPELVGNWLYGVAYYTAQNARAARARRRAAEKQVREMNAPPTTVKEVWDDLQPLLDEELSRLPEKYRAPLVLCELNGKSRKEAARQLRCPEGTLSSRLARARQLLRRRLARRGLTLSTAALVGALSPGTASASVPAPLMTNTVKAAMRIAAGQATAVSASVAALTEGVLKTMFLIRLKIVTAICLTAGLLVGGVGVLTHRALADKSAPAKKEAAAPGQKEGKKERGPSIHGMVQAVDLGKHTLTVTVRVEGTKQTENKTFALAPAVKVLLDNGLGKKQPLEEGKLTDLAEGTSVALELAADQKVVGIVARGPAIRGSLQAVDPGQNTITLTAKEGKGGVSELTVALAKGAKVLLNEGLKKGDPDKEGKLSDLTPGTPVIVQLSVDRKTALNIRVLGASIQGRVKGVDAGSNTITVTLKEDAQIVDKTFNLSKDVQVDGNLADLTPGTPVILQLSVFDKNKIVGIRTKKGAEE